MIISNDEGVFNFISLIKMKDYTVKILTEILSIVNVKAGAVDELPRTINSKKRKIPHQQRTKVSSERRLFSKMNFVTCRSSYHSSCYRILNRILNWQGLR